MSMIRSIATGLVVAGLAVGSTAVLVRAATLNSKYTAELGRLQREWRAQQQAEGLNPGAQRKALYGKYPTPEMSLARVVQLAPGQSGTLTVPGKFTPQTVFLLENDQVTLGAPTVSPKGLSAQVSVASDAVPGFARLYAYTPVSGAWRAVPAVLVGAPPTFDLAASNGWTVKVVPEAKTFTLEDRSATVAYVAEFYKPGEAKAFERATGRLVLDGERAPTDDWSFSINPAEEGSAMAEMEQLQKQMSDPNAFMRMSDAQREALMAKVTAVSERLAREAQASVADPAAAQRKQDAFGCQHLSLRLTDRTVTGAVSCGRDVGRLDLTGSRQ